MPPGMGGPLPAGEPEGGNGGKGGMPRPPGAAKGEAGQCVCLYVEERGRGGGKRLGRKGERGIRGMKPGGGPP